MNFNKYDEVVNGNMTYKEIARRLKNNETIGIGWTDEDSTHLDIIFKCEISKVGCFQRGIKSDYLYVSIIDHTSYAFMPDTIKNAECIKEKIRMNNDCGDKVSELINGIIRELNSI